MSSRQASDFVDLLVSNGVRMCTGVPDSLLGALSAELERNETLLNITAPNEGLALSAAAGFQIATGTFALVYLQNSGLGNLINPYLSLMHKHVYGIPIFMIVGWRGEDPDADEPQHKAQGQKTIQMLELMDIEVIPLTPDADLQAVVIQAMKLLHQGQSVAILASQNSLGSVKTIASESRQPERRDWLRELHVALNKRAIVVSTTGKTSRELYELQSPEDRQRTFYCIGGMGHASSVAMGLALGQPQTPVVCVDGDGSLQMHAGSLFMLGNMHPKNLIHVIINNGVHESVGGQQVSNPSVDYAELALLAGYATARDLEDPSDFKDVLEELQKGAGPHLLVCHASPLAPAKLGRPSGKPKEWISEFISTIAND
jgi:phosphonopyruvate decarboxylase